MGYNDGYTSAYYTIYPAAWQTGWLAGYYYVDADVDVNISGDQKPEVKPDITNLPTTGSVQIPKPPEIPSFQIPDHQSRFSHSSVPNRPSLPGLRR